MRIRIEDLDPEGVEVVLDIGTGWARQAVGEALDGPVAALGGRLTVRPVGPGVVVQGHARASVDRACDRCLASVRLDLAGDVDLYFQAPPAGSEREIALSPDDMDTGFLEDGELCLGAVLAEFFLLEAPGVLRCGEAGVTRLEDGACSTPSGEPGAAPDPDPRLAALKGFKPA
jgi:uncharacterized metal-binding protein YceD (DUF177 family)